MWSRKLRGWEEVELTLINKIVLNLKFGEGRDRYWFRKNKDIMEGDCYKLITFEPQG